MGYLYYGTEMQPTEIPDRVLAHLRVVATTKLRRGESFTLTWREPHGRTSIWMQPSIPLKFVFDSAEAETLDRDWLKSMANAANTSSGLALDWTEESTRLEVVPSEHVELAA